MGLRCLFWSEPRLLLDPILHSAPPSLSWASQKQRPSLGLPHAQSDESWTGCGDLGESQVYARNLLIGLFVGSRGRSLDAEWWFSIAQPVAYPR